MELIAIVQEKKDLENRVVEDINNFLKKYPELSLLALDLSVSNIHTHIKVGNDGKGYFRPGVTNFYIKCEMMGDPTI